MYRLLQRFVLLFSVATLLVGMMPGPALAQTGVDPNTIEPGFKGIPYKLPSQGGPNAQTGGTGTGGLNLGIGAPEIGNSEVVGTVPKLVKSGFNIIIIVAGVVFVVLLLIGGVMYLTSFGNDDQTKKAKQLLFDAVIGLVLTVSAWAIGTYVLNLLGLSISL